MNLSKLLPTEVFIAMSIEFYDNTDVLKWGRETTHLDHFAGDPFVPELLSINNKVQAQLDLVPKIFEYFIKKTYPDFQISHPDSEMIAKSLFEIRLRDYLDDKCRPWDVCRMIGPIENFYDFSEWLGNMYHACDWIEPNHKPVNCRHLEDEIKVLLKK